jgi:hypothetical protein
MEAEAVIGTPTMAPMSAPTPLILLVEGSRHHLGIGTDTLTPARGDPRALLDVQP